MLNMSSRALREYQVDPVAAQALDLAVILHADHEQNASTTPCAWPQHRTNPYASLSAGVSGAVGSAHGGANEAVLNMLEEIGRVENIPKYLTLVKDKGSHSKLMASGIGVYKNSILGPRSSARPATGCSPSSATRKLRCSNWRCALEEIASRTNTSSRAKLYPNVDFYSGLI